MQDLSTGEMRDITKFLGDIPELSPQQTLRELTQRLDRACQQAEPDPRKRGPVFMVGETIEIRGGKFEVARIEPEGIFLKGIPSL